MGLGVRAGSQMVLKALLACCFATCSRGYVSQQAGPLHPTPPTAPPHLRYMGLYVCTHTGSPLPPGAPTLANCLDGDLEELSGWVNLAFSRNATTLRKARRLGMPLNPTYSLAQLQAGAWRALQKSKGSCIDPTRLEASLSEEAFESAFGMDKAAFARLPSFERKRRKAILMLV